MLQGVPCSKYALKEIAWGEKRSSERNGGRFMIDPFSRSVIRLTGQARSFQANIADESVEDLVKYADTCETALQQLYTYAEKQKVDINQYYPQIASIEGSLQRAKKQIQQKVDNAEPSQRPLWMQSLGSVNVALRLASGLTHLARRASGLGVLQ